MPTDHRSRLDKLDVNLAVAVRDGTLALLLQRLHSFWTLPNSGMTDFDGKHWIYKTYDDWRTDFPWLSWDQFKRLVRKGRNLGVLVTRRTRDRGQDYRINYDRLADLFRRADVHLTQWVAENTTGDEGAFQTSLDVAKDVAEAQQEAVALLEVGLPVTEAQEPYYPEEAGPVPEPAEVTRAPVLEPAAQLLKDRTGNPDVETVNRLATRMREAGTPLEPADMARLIEAVDAEDTVAYVTTVMRRSFERWGPAGVADDLGRMVRRKTAQERVKPTQEKRYH